MEKEVESTAIKYKYKVHINWERVMKGKENN